MNLTVKEERILEEGKGRGNVVIKIQSQTRRVNKKLTVFKYLTIYIIGFS